MDEEANEGEGSQEEDNPPTKRVRTEAMVLDCDEVDIASGLRPIQGTSRAAQDKDDSGAEGDGERSNDFDFSGDGRGTGFEDNGVCCQALYVLPTCLFLWSR